MNTGKHTPERKPKASSAESAGKSAVAMVRTAREEKGEINKEL